jgi:hypothetical protein
MPTVARPEAAAEASLVRTHERWASLVRTHPPLPVLLMDGAAFVRLLVFCVLIALCVLGAAEKKYDNDESLARPRDAAILVLLTGSFAFTSIVGCLIAIIFRTYEGASRNIVMLVALSFFISTRG